METRTLADIFSVAVSHNLERYVMFTHQDQRQFISSRKYYGYVTAIARALKQWGLRKGDRVAIVAENRPEWMIADFACVCTGIVDVPIYATLTAEQTAYVLSHSGARVVFLSTLEQLRKVQSIRAQTSVEKIVMMDNVGELNVIAMWPIMEQSSTDPDPEFDEQARHIQPDDLATLIYTSGTTGTSKGVMLTHGNLTSVALTSTRQSDWRKGDLCLSFLPLSHVTARHIDYVCLLNGVTLAYCSFDQLPKMLKEAQPTIFVGVPRVYEKVRQEVERRAGGGIKKKIMNWALRVGQRHEREILNYEKPKALSWKLADKLVYSKLRAGFGGRGRLYFSGGAPLGKDMGDWFCWMSIAIAEGYGLTETSPTISVNRRGNFKVGTVGKPNDIIQVKVAEDGEILVKGPQVFKGYWNNAEETNAAFTPDGWFKTGDIGQIDGDGYLNITDRKKDLIKTSGGKFIAPQPIENALKTNVLIAQAAVIGDKRKYASVILSPHFPLLEDWARANQISFSSRRELVANNKVRDLYRGIVEDANKKLAQFETIKKIMVVPDEFSVATGEITPTLKLKRRIIETKYKDQIEELYREPHPVETAPVG